MIDTIKDIRVVLLLFLTLSAGAVWALDTWVESKGYATTSQVSEAIATLSGAIDAAFKLDKADRLENRIFELELKPVKTDADHALIARYIRQKGELI